jgi:hypothetical protein
MIKGQLMATPVKKASQMILSLAAYLFCSSAMNAFADNSPAADRDFGFRRGRDGFRGNERSERPGRFMPGQLRHGGSGCPEGTMRVVFAPDNLSFTVLFDRFVADTATGARERRDRMSCEATLPIQIPEGQQMEITRVDYRGFVSIPQGGRGSLHSVFNFVEDEDRIPGRPGFGRGRGRWRDRDRINVRYNFFGPISENYEISTGTMNEGRGLLQSEVSPCGGEAQLRLRNDVVVISPQGQQAQLTVDSIDGSANAVYFVNWRSCQAQPPVVQPPPPPPPPGCGPRGCGPGFPWHRPPPPPFFGGPGRGGRR